MDKIYHTSNNSFIAYNNNKSNKKNMPSVIFLHGLMSNMNGEKALFLENYCKKFNYNFIRFDNFGHGESSGKFLDQTIGLWLTGLELILEQLAQHPTILIGSSIGAWIAILATLKFPNKVKGLICIAPAIDFTEEIIWNNLTDAQKEQMKQQKWLEISGQNCNSKYPITYQLICEARNYLLLNKATINLKIVVHLIHGMLDSDVPYSISTRLAQKINNDMVVTKLIKNGDHRLSRETDLDIIANSLQEIIKQLS